MTPQFWKFLREELAISADSLTLAQRQGGETPHQLSIVLWQYGLITLNQLELLWDWLDATC
ncbi:MAG: DUF2949 domain-containing protein [Cyanophyceae cyanobacterium]